LPEWTVNSIEDDTAYIHVPDPDYEVTVPFSVTLRDIELQEDFLLTTTDAGIKIYDEACAPVLGCWYLVRGEEIYLAAFEVAESTEPMPADLGGVWFPSVDVSDEELYNIILSAR